MPVVWSATSKIRPMRPRNTPMAISPNRRTNSASGVAGRSGIWAVTTGVTTTDMASAIKSLTRGGTYASPKPGITIKAAPVRVNTRNMMKSS